MKKAANYLPGGRLLAAIYVKDIHAKLRFCQYFQWFQGLHILSIYLAICERSGRAFGSHPRGRGFESLRLHHL